MVARVFGDWREYLLSGVGPARRMPVDLRLGNVRMKDAD
jgi:hypothetical protein